MLDHPLSHTLVWAESVSADMPIVLDDLPAEILSLIGQQLPRKDLVNLALLNRDLHSSLLPVLFHRIEVRRWDSSRALEALNIEPQTWANVRDLAISIDLTAGAAELPWYYLPPVSKPGDNMRRTYFRILPPLRKLIVKISADSLSPGKAVRVLDSPFWQRILNLLTQKNSSTGLLEASSLDLHLPPAEHLPPSSEVWRLLIQPFTNFKNLSVFLTLSKAFGTPADDAEQLLRAFNSERIQGLHVSVTSTSALRVAAALKNVASLKIRFSDLDVCRDFWTLIGSMSSLLQSLTVDKTEHVLLPALAKKIVMKALKNLEISGTSVALLFGDRQSIHMPVLKHIQLAFDLTWNKDFTATSNASATMSAVCSAALGNLASSLPSDCFQNYYIKASGTVQEWAQHARNLEALFSAQILRIDAIVVNNTPATATKPQLFGTDIDTTFGRGHSSVINLGIRILPYTESDPTRWCKIEFANLESLTIHMQMHNEEWGNFILFMLLDRIQAPQLVSLTFQDASHAQLMGRHVTTLNNMLPRFTKLRQVLLKSTAQNAKPVGRLRESCASRGIGFISTAL